MKEQIKKITKDWRDKELDINEKYAKSNFIPTTTIVEEIIKNDENMVEEILKLFPTAHMYPETPKEEGLYVIVSNLFGARTIAMSSWLERCFWVNGLKAVNWIAWFEKEDFMNKILPVKTEEKKDGE